LQEKGLSVIYFDNAATSWPKPPQVKEAMVKFMDEIGANPGRSGYFLSIEAARVLHETREALCLCFNMKDSSRIVFAHNATESINLALKGLLKPGDHVITSSMEHNSVMRPLRDLEKRGIEIKVNEHFEEFQQILKNFTYKKGIGLPLETLGIAGFFYLVLKKEK
jgi:selenocysteine lyase/cysteine desulfurase